MKTMKVHKVHDLPKVTELACVRGTDLTGLHALGSVTLYQVGLWYQFKNNKNNNNVFQKKKLKGKLPKYLSAVSLLDSPYEVTMIPSLLGSQTQFLQDLTGNTNKGSQPGGVCRAPENRKPIKKKKKEGSRDPALHQIRITPGRNPDSPKGSGVSQSSPPEVPSSKIFCCLKARSATTTDFIKYLLNTKRHQVPRRWPQKKASTLRSLRSNYLSFE